MGGGSSSKSKLGKIVLQQRFVSSEELEGMLTAQDRKRGFRLASIGARLGALSIPDSLRAISEEHGVPPVVLSQMVLHLGQLVLVPEEIAREHAVLPFEATSDRVLLAMATPWERSVVEEMEFLIGRTVELYVALPEDIGRVIPEAYAAHAVGDVLYAGPAVSQQERDAVGLPAKPKRAPEGSGPEAGGEQQEASVDAQSITAQPAPIAAQPAPIAAQPAPIAAQPIGGRPEPPVTAPASSISAAVVAVAAPTVVGTPPAVLPVAEPEPAPAADEPTSPRLDPAFSEPPMVAAEPQLNTDLSDRHLIVADASGDTADALSAALAATRVRFTRADAGKATMTAIRDGAPDLLVLDATLPEVNGLDICRRVRASERFAELPIILFSELHTGWRFEADLRDCFNIHGLFEKPLDLPRLTRTIARVLSGQPVTDAPGPLAPDAEAELGQGMAAFERGDIDSAIAHLEAGTALDPQAFQLQYHLGLLYGRTDRFFPAIAALETATRLQKRHFSALKNLAVVYQRVGFRRKALETWERAMWAAPDEDTRVTIKDHMVTLL